MPGDGTRSGRDRRRREYGQNFLRHPGLAADLVRGARVGPSDLVVEIGAGTGALTAPLARRADRVIAVERDPVWAARLRHRFAGVGNVDVVCADALSWPLPRRPFRVMSSVPFGLTTALLHRLLDDPRRPLLRADLIVQWEVARKRAIHDRPNLLNASWAPWWEFRLGRRLPATAFRPLPAVDAGVLVVIRRDPPLVPAEDRPAYVRTLRRRFGRVRGR